MSIKHIVMVVLLLCALPLSAQIVDTWRFSTPQQQQHAFAIARQLRCPQCQNQNLLDSNAPVAVAMRHQVFRMVAEGQSEAQIMDWMTQRYGDFVRYRPPLTRQTVLLWALPWLLLIALAGVLWRAVRGQREARKDDASAIDQ